MACVVEQDDQMEAMVDTLTIDEAPMEDEESGIQYEDAESISELEEQSEEALTTTSSLDSEDAEESMSIKVEEKKVIIPPLRPLTIAPKPAKLPVSIKPVAGQQLLLVQGGGAGQQIKLLSTAQALSLSNLSIAKPITIKQSPKASAISIVQPKKVVMKKVVPKTLTKAFDGKSGQQIVVLQKSDNQVKLLPTTASKTLTLSQAQQMGLISSTKIIPHGAKQILLNKGGQSKAIKIIPHIRPPTKILPAPQTTSSASIKGSPRIFLSKTNVGPAHIVPGQIIQVPNSQSGQLHPINIPGKGLQYIKIITTTQSSDAQTTTTTATTVGKVVTTKVTTAGATQSPKSFIKISKPITPVSGGRALPIVPVKQQIVTARISSSSNQPQEVEEDEVPSSQTSAEVAIESNGIKTRKPCNCAKSQCLKLYCDCFANGEFCFMCNCSNCYNNLENEEHRNRAIKNCLERNPNAFRPKIGKGKETGEVAVRKHTKGCNCKRSGCLKNYCECYEAKIACSNNCKCLGCKNVESGGGLSIGFGAALQSAADESNFFSSDRKSSDSNHRGRRSSSSRQPFNFINNAVVEATSQCLITKAKTGEEIAETEELSKREIIEEFGRCLKQIIDCSASKDMQVK